MMENVELNITTNNIPKSFRPMSKIANGTHATLGKVCKPTAKEPMVFPNPVNLTIARPIVRPIRMDIINPIANRYIVISILVINVIFSKSSKNDPPTVKGDGNDTVGNIFNRKSNCHIPKNTVINSEVSARFWTSILLLILILLICSDCNISMHCHRTNKIMFL